MILLRWAPYPQTDVVAYRVYRSIVGVVATNAAPAALAGLTLTLSFDDAAPTTVTFSADGGTAVEQINALAIGGRAIPALLDPAKFLIRSDTRESPGKVQIVGGTALPALALTARTYTEKSDDFQIADVMAPTDPTQVVTFDDPDGTAQDWYAVSTVSALGEESFKSQYLQATTATGAVCVIEGLVTDLQGVRIPDCEVQAIPQNAPISPGTATHVTLTPITALTREDGRFSIALLQGADVLLEIPAIGYSQNIKVPAQAYAFITDLAANTDFRGPVDYK